MRDEQARELDGDWRGVEGERTCGIIGVYLTGKVGLLFSFFLRV